jgi:hypothetical protein
MDASPRTLTVRSTAHRLLLLPALMVALNVGVLAAGAGTAAAANGVDLTFARVLFGDGTGHYGTGGSPQTGEYVLWVYDASGNLVNSATSAPADIDVPLAVGATTLSFRGSYFPFNPVISSFANELTLSLNGSGGPDLVIDDSANSGTPQNPQVTSTTANGYAVSVSNFAFTESGQPDLVSPFTAFPGPWSNSTGSFTLTVTHVPTTTTQCKKNGWTTYTDASGTSFKDQGDCVSYVATGGRNLAAG